MKMLHTNTKALLTVSKEPTGTHYMWGGGGEGGGLQNELD